MPRAVWKLICQTHLPVPWLNFLLNELLTQKYTLGFVFRLIMMLPALYRTVLIIKDFNDL